MCMKGDRDEESGRGLGRECVLVLLKWNIDCYCLRQSYHLPFERVIGTENENDKMNMANLLRRSRGESYIIFSISYIASKILLESLQWCHKRKFRRKFLWCIGLSKI